MTDAIRIGRLDHRDAATAAQIHVLLLPAYAQEAALLQAAPPPPLQRTAADIQASTDSHWGAWIGDELAGALSAGEDDEPAQRCIAMLVVHPRHQRRGLARALLQALLRDEAMHTHAVSTGARNAPALALYAAMGFGVYRQGQLGRLAMLKLRRAASRPATLDAAGIAARVPHTGRMCLLHRLLQWSPQHIVCSAVSHRAPDHPLRSAGGLLAPVAIEYASQAMALHGALSGAADGASGSVSWSASVSTFSSASDSTFSGAPTPGFLASVRAVTLHVPRLDTVVGDLCIRAQQQAGDARQALYHFTLHDGGGALLVDGRATVILNARP